MFLRSTGWVPGRGPRGGADSRSRKQRPTLLASYLHTGGCPSRCSPQTPADRHEPPPPPPPPPQSPAPLLPLPRPATRTAAHREVLKATVTTRHQSLQTLITTTSVGLQVNETVTPASV
ncbi:Protein of unknown function [Gryllus bimaculatus]|nr:Protein of unknown function [Gryllus bimaculatus]